MGTFLNSISGKLLNFSSTAKSLKLIPAPYWTAEIYGFGKQISHFGFYPYCLPLCVYTDHGPVYHDVIPPHELESTAPVQLYHSPVSVRLWSSVTSKKAYCMQSPTVYYRRRYGIKKTFAAKGTLAFPAHSTPSIDDLSGYVKYVESLKNLPEMYHPITVCLHMHDINKGLDAIFVKNEFKVVSAGDPLDQKFISRFYAILKECCYTTSNIPGSYAYYSVEMGIPFFIYGEMPVWINKSDLNINLGLYDPFKSGYGKEVYELFEFENYAERCPEISQGQEDFVAKHLGLIDGISRLEMAKLLYTSFGKWALSKEGLRYIWERNIFARIYRKVFKKRTP